MVKSSLPRSFGKSSVEKPDGKDENVAYHYPRDEETFEELLSKNLKSDRYLEAHAPDIRLWRAFRRAFNLHHVDLNEKEIIVYDPERDVAITRAFSLEDSEHLTFVTERRADAHMLRVKGNIAAIKGQAEWHEFDRQGFIVVAMDDDIRVTKHLLKNVQRGGWFLCGIQVASALRGTGKYELKGVIERGPYPTVNKNVGEDFWKDIHVSNISEYDAAKKVEGMVTKDEAREKLIAAGRKPGDDVIAEYVALLEAAKKQGHDLDADGNFVYKTKRDGVDVDVKLNPVLPTKENEHANDVVVMRRLEGI